MAAVMNCCHPLLKYLNANTATTQATVNITKSTTPLLENISNGIRDMMHIGRFILFLKNASRNSAVRVNGTM